MHYSKLILAQDVPPVVDSTVMMEEIAQQPSSYWREYLQPIISLIQSELHLSFVLREPKLVDKFGSLSLGFSITGELVFRAGDAKIIQSIYGNSPVYFEATVGADGKLHQPVRVFVNVVERGETLTSEEADPR